MCQQEAEETDADGKVLVCDQCKHHMCDPCAHERFGKGAMVSCQLCSSELCAGCILACDQCDWQVCDRCVAQGKSKENVYCNYCATLLCTSCNDKVWGEGMRTGLSCIRCGWEVCNLCMQHGKGKGSGKHSGRGVLQCDHCDMQLCQPCSSTGRGGGKGDTLSGCDRCDRQVCDRCIVEGKGKESLCCDFCDTALCPSCNDKGKGQGIPTILSCSRCGKEICDHCVGNVRGTTEYKSIGIALLCESCKGWDFFADYKELRVQLDAREAEKRTLQSKIDELTSQLDAFIAEKWTREMQLAAFKAENGTLQRKVDELTKLETCSQVLPSSAELAGFLRDTLPKLRPGMYTTVPIQALRWTHNGINAQLAFGDDHENAQESIFKLFEQLFRERWTSLELTEEDPLPVLLHRGPDNHLGLYSRGNRRLTTLLMSTMYQALRREELVKVHVLVRSPDDPRPHSQKVQEALDLLASQMKQRPSSRAKDEESVTFANTEEGGEEVTWSYESVYVLKRAAEDFALTVLIAKVGTHRCGADVAWSFRLATDPATFRWSIFQAGDSGNTQNKQMTKRRTLETFIVIFRGRRSTLEYFRHVVLRVFKSSKHCGNGDADQAAPSKETEWKAAEDAVAAYALAAYKAKLGHTTALPRANVTKALCQRALIPSKKNWSYAGYLRAVHGIRSCICIDTGFRYGEKTFACFFFILIISMERYFDFIPVLLLRLLCHFFLVHFCSSFIHLSSDTGLVPECADFEQKKIVTEELPPEAFSRHVVAGVKNWSWSDAGSLHTGTGICVAYGIGLRDDTVCLLIHHTHSILGSSSGLRYAFGGCYFVSVQY
eukprot:s253_g12.t2